MGNAAEMVRIGLALDFIGALDLAAIRIWGMPNKPGCWATFEPSPQLVESKLDPINFETFWLKPSHAQLVHSLCRAPADHHEGADTDPKVLRDHIVNTAAHLGAPFRSTAEVVAVAYAAVDQILAHVETQRLNGGLAQVNAAYKLYRQQQAAKNERAIPYSAHLHAFTKQLVTMAARTAEVI